MGSLTETIKTFNSAVRTVTLVVFVVMFGVAGFWTYDRYTANERALQQSQWELAETQNQLVSLKSDLELTKADLAEKVVLIEKLETSLKLLKTDQRLARLNVLRLEKGDSDQVLSSHLEFVELSPQGEPLSPPKQFTLPGDVVYVDNWVVKFDDHYIEQADIERGTSLVLFRRIFSEQQQPSEGVSLDEVGMRPQAYARGGGLSEFEKKLWGEFWEFANQPKRAAEMGIRAANGEAISIQVREDMSYELRLRSSGGLSFTPIENSPASQPPAKASIDN
jgi:hypothetical protein